MNAKRSPYDLIIELRHTITPNLSEDILKRIFKLEERVQYDEDRGDIVSEIRKIVQASVEQQLMEGEKDETH